MEIIGGEEGEKMWTTKQKPPHGDFCAWVAEILHDIQGDGLDVLKESLAVIGELVKSSPTIHVEGNQSLLLCFRQNPSDRVRACLDPTLLQIPGNHAHEIHSPALLHDHEKDVEATDLKFGDPHIQKHINIIDV